jgi:hypothetical protein
VASENGNGNGNGLPPPEPVWIALGLITWALASALSKAARTRFIDTLDALCSDHAARNRIAAFRHISPKTRHVPHATRVALAYLRRIIAELRAAHGRGT